MSFLKVQQGRIHICAEIGATHGSLEETIDLLRQLKGSGIDSVKFQTHKTSDLVGEDYEIEYQTYHGPRKSSMRELMAAREFSDGEMELLVDWLQVNEVPWFSTPDTQETINKLIGWGSFAIKISGADMNYLNLIRAAGRSGKPVMLDARCTEEELKAAVNAVVEQGNRKIMIVHCPSGYPTADEDVALGNLERYEFLANGWSGALGGRLGLSIEVGFSDHSEGWGMCLAAVAAGATYIEKTFTLDRNIDSPEHVMSLLPAEAQGFVSGVRAVDKAMTRKPSKPNTQHRRGLFALFEIARGMTLEWDSVAYKRPGDGISVSEAHKAVGRKLKRQVLAGQKLEWEDLE